MTLLLPPPLVGKVHCMDALELMRLIPAQSVDAIIPNICYNVSRTTAYRWDMSEIEICRLYVEEKLTLRQIADRFNTNHHMIRRILTRYGVEITTKGRIRKPFSDEHKRRISESGKGRISWIKGKKMGEDYRRTNMKGRSYTNIDLDKYADYDRLLFLKKIFSKRRNEIGIGDKFLAPFLDRFYFDPQFNAIYDAWIASGKDRWHRPTLDHKTCLANGGGWELENLQILTWFENRAKADMNENDWLKFCEATHTISDLFIRK